ncbi:aldose 1-epimerase [Saccharopolyspora shandongensis]|uniref:Aldose 1-epimerase n=1 Tax=Saccharopolyspora shandongensis TaxID=418495 RepID=A0A1H3NWL0_9PSEU|nr:aldose 1-epimerase family protein [Saccharopolyspora shandongensis]SDY93100.1 aldose 1-epimerase [Saccharopolyspora shandongensis]
MRRFSRRAALATAAGATTAAALSGSAAAQPADPGGGRWTANGRLYEIRSGRQRAVIAGVSATLLSWQVDGVEMLLTHPADDVGEGYQGKTILPWPNRIDHGRYTFGGKELQVAINEPERDTALHGLMSFVEWQPVRHCADGVALEYVLPPDYGYPFRLAFRIEYEVDATGVRSTLSAKNIGDTDAPFGTANHTYLGAGGDRIDDIVFELPADTYYVVDDRLIPTGTAPVEGTDYDFRSPRPIGATEMDTAFTGLSRGGAVVRFARPDGVTAELWVDRTHGYLQVYTDDSPATDRPGRAGITVEPMTCAPNAFVTGDGLITLRPGETHRGTWGYRIAG